jgi:hypothetical protein
VKYEYHDDKSRASDPAGLTLSPRRYRRLRGMGGIVWELLGRAFGTKYPDLVREHLECGDSRAALVVATSPLLVAAYTDELDCVVMLRFPRWLVREHGLEVGSRLLAVITYPHDENLARDLDLGPAHHGQFLNAHPQIGEFLSGDVERMEARKREIEEGEWRRCAELAAAYRQTHGDRARDGAIYFTALPAR